VAFAFPPTDKHASFLVAFFSAKDWRARSAGDSLGFVNEMSSDDAVVDCWVKERPSAATSAVDV